MTTADAARALLDRVDQFVRESCEPLFVTERETLRAALEAPHGMTEAMDGCEFCLGAKGGVPGNENVIGGKILCDYCHALLIAMQAARPIEAVAYLRDIDGTGSFHPCAEGDPGAFPVFSTPIAPVQDDE